MRLRGIIVNVDKRSPKSSSFSYPVALSSFAAAPPSFSPENYCCSHRHCHLQGPIPAPSLVHCRPQARPVTRKSRDNLVLKSEGPVVVEFYTSWCRPCQMVHREIDEIAGEYKEKVQCLMLNTDKNLDVAEKYDIKAAPVVLIFKDGKKQDSIIGTMPKEFYVAAIDKALAL